MEAPDFWNDPDKSASVNKEIKGLKDTIAEFDEIKSMYEDVGAMIEMAEEADDQEMFEEVGQMLADFKEKFENFRIETYLSGEFDTNDATLKISAGAGGTESCDWCSMLYRMYTRWAEKRGYGIETLDYLDGDEAGIKTVTIQISGYHAYGYLKSEHGVHRLVRISPFNANGKRQTSFCSVEVMPVIDKSIEVEINEDVQCQNERSQHQNRDKAMEMLKAKLYLLKKAEQDAAMSDIRGEVASNGFGSQIRSYVLQPYTMVKDHRTSCEVGDAQRVLDGGLDPFINAYLSWISQK